MFFSFIIHSILNVFTNIGSNYISKCTLNIYFFFLQTTVQEDKQNITLEIKKILDDLSKDGLKEFHFYEFTKSTNQSIPRGKLEGKDTKDTAKIMTDHYGNYEAVQVTRHILLNINQRPLACDLEKKTGKTTNVKKVFK